MLNDLYDLIDQNDLSDLIGLQWLKMTKNGLEWLRKTKNDPKCEAIKRGIFYCFYRPLKRKIAVVTTVNVK